MISSSNLLTHEKLMNFPIVRFKNLFDAPLDTAFCVVTRDAISGDFDGNGKADLAVYRPDSSGSGWYILQSSDGYVRTASFGLPDDKPISADFDGDGKTDIAVYRPSTSAWYIQGSTQGFYGVQFGVAGDVPVAGDYDGNGKTDVAVWSPSNGRWRVLNSSNNSVTEDYFGGQAFNDVPVPAAFNR